MIDRIPVQSSNVVSIGWADETLEVEFKSGVYRYANVPQSVFDDLMAAPSKGKFINATIVGAYATEKVAA